MVFQETNLVPSMNVAQNIFLGREPTRFGFVDRPAMERRARPLFDRLGLRIDLDRPVRDLRIADQQLIEIAKALILDARVLILDEPNSALDSGESERLFGIVRDLRDRGTGILYISHRREEVIAIADRISVLRNGRKVAEHAQDRASVAGIVREMLGDRAGRVEHRAAGRTLPRGSGTGAALTLADVAPAGGLRGCTVEARPGEVVGLAGLEGSGAEEVLDLLFGRRRLAAGRVGLPGGGGVPRSTARAVRDGIALVPADRRTEGLALRQDIGGNLNTVVAGALGRLGPVPTAGRMARLATAQAESLGLRHGGLDDPVYSLSGGNQQKVVIGKWLAADPRLILLNDPTRGVDVGAKDEIYAIVDRLAEEGRIVLFRSSELGEYALVCTRVLLFRDGRLFGEMPGPAATEHDLLEAINLGRVHAAPDREAVDP